MLLKYFSESQLDQLEPLAQSMPEQPYLANDIASAGGPVRYQYAYAFDTFRRGWQYATSSAVTGRQIWYCPHRIRQLALESGSRSWLESSREKYWSWGRCLANVIESAQDMSEPERVSDWINGIVESNPPRWVGIPESIWAQPDSREGRIAVRDLVEVIEGVARSARIPMMLMKRPPLAVKLANLAVVDVIEELKLGTIEGVLQMLPTKAVAERLTFQVAEGAKDAVNFFYKGTFGYPGLISPLLRQRSAPPRRAEYLL